VILNSYWRATSAYRLRIALNLKGLAYETHSVHLVKNGGEQHSPAYRAINPQGRVPSLVLENGEVLIQSPAIIEWLEETHPSPPLLPKDPMQRARIRAVAAIIGCDIHPLGNVAPLNYLRKNFGADDAACAAWVNNWVTQGFTAIEALIEGGDYCFGKAPGLADVYLVPQVFAARRFKVPLDQFPKIVHAADHCTSLDPFVRAAPQNQPDAE
jgi:maleylacetoacetate isomerase